jgi:hypothetical protein
VRRRDRPVGRRSPAEKKENGQIAHRPILPRLRTARIAQEFRIRHGHGRARNDTCSAFRNVTLGGEALRNVEWTPDKIHIQGG